MASSENRKILRNIAKAIELFPEIVAKKKRAYKYKKAILKRFAPLSQKLAKMESQRTLNRSHPWRICPLGQHWVSSHPLHIPVSNKNPMGVTLRDGHCRTNPSKKDQLYTDEIQKMAIEYFAQVKHLPKPNLLGRPNGNKFDLLIAGWTQYWNEVFQPATPLPPNLVKALISTESDFKVTAKVLASEKNWARGLMQVTDQTLSILKDEKGELKDYLVNVDQGDIHDPNLNIAAGIRWLFHKKFLLEKRKKREVTWEEAVMEYKAYTNDLKKGQLSAVRQWKKFLKRYESLERE